MGAKWAGIRGRKPVGLVLRLTFLIVIYGIIHSAYLWYRLVQRPFISDTFVFPYAQDVGLVCTCLLSPMFSCVWNFSYHFVTSVNAWVSVIAPWSLCFGTLLFVLLFSLCFLSARESALNNHSAVHKVLLEASVVDGKSTSLVRILKNNNNRSINSCAGNKQETVSTVSFSAVQHTSIVTMKKVFWQHWDHIRHHDVSITT